MLFSSIQGLYSFESEICIIISLKERILSRLFAPKDFLLILAQTHISRFEPVSLVILVAKRPDGVTISIGLHPCIIHSDMPGEPVGTKPGCRGIFPGLYPVNI